MNEKLRSNSSLPFIKSLEKLTTLEIKCKRLPENVSELFSKMPNVEKLFIDLTDLDVGKITGNSSIQSLPPKNENISREMLDICYSLVDLNKNLTYIQINGYEYHRDDIVLLKRSLSHFYQSMSEKYPETIEINHQSLPFKLLESDTELKALLARNSDEIGSYLYSKLTMGNKNSIGEANRLLWSFPFENLTDLLPIAGKTFNWLFFSEIIKFLFRVWNTTIQIQNTNELCVYLRLITASNLDNASLISEYFLSPHDSVLLDSLSPVFFCSSLIRNIIETIRPAAKFNIEPLVNFNFPFQEFLHLTNQNILELVTFLLDVFLNLHEKQTPESSFNVQKYFDTFQRFFGSEFGSLVEDMKTKKMSEHDKIFIKEFFPSVDEFYSEYPNIIVPSDSFFESDLIRLKPFQQQTNEDVMEILKANLKERFDTVARKCPICLYEMLKGEYRAAHPERETHDLRHEFHKACLQTWFKKSSTRTCPSCRKPF